MGRWGNFLQRKTPELAIVVPVPVTQQEPSTAPGELETLQDAINLHSARLSSMEEENRILGEQLGEVAHLSARLKIQVSEGATNAHAVLDTLSREEVVIGRQRAGLDSRIAELRRELAPLLARGAELSLLRDQTRQDEFVAQLNARVMAMTDNLLRDWRAICENAFDMMESLEEPLSGAVNLDPEHKSRVLQINNAMSERLFAASLEQVNNNWRFLRPGAFPLLKITPGKPPADRARAAG